MAQINFFPSSFSSSITTTSTSSVNVVSLPTTLNDDLNVSNNSFIIQNNFYSRIEPTQFVTQTIGVNGALGGASIFVSGSNLNVQSGNSASLSICLLQSKNAVLFYPGQISETKFSCIYDNPNANGFLQYVGVGSVENGIFLGYANDQFGININHNGKRGIQKLSMASASSHTENITITLIGMDVSVPVTSGTLLQNVNEIVSYDYSNILLGWNVFSIGTDIYFSHKITFEESGFAITGSSISGSFNAVRNTQVANDIFIPQSSFNLDTLDGSGSSGYILNPQSANIYKIIQQNFGYGVVILSVQNSSSNSFIPFHTFNYLNSGSTLTTYNPNMPFAVAAVNQGAEASSVTVKVNSVSANIQGNIINNGIKQSITNTKNILANTPTNIFSIRNSFIFENAINYSDIKLLDISVASNSLSPIKISLKLNPQISGALDWQEIDNARNSCAHFEFSGSLVTGGSSIFGSSLGAGNDLQKDIENFNFHIAPGDVLACVAESTSGSADVTIGLTWQEIH